MRAATGEAQVTRANCGHLAFHERILGDADPSGNSRQTRRSYAGWVSSWGTTLRSMARYAIDAPTLWYLVDEHVPVHPSHQLVAPNSIRSEALQLLLWDVREGKRSEADALACHEQLTQLQMRLLGDRVSRRTAWRIARERSWKSLRDAEYLAVAALQADAFITVDRGMVAKAEDLVRIASVGELGAEG